MRSSSAGGIRVLDGSPESDGGMVKVVPDRYSGHASHGRVLDCAVRRTRAARHPSGLRRQLPSFTAAVKAMGRYLAVLIYRLPHER